jgi:hypothetical protein
MKLDYPVIIYLKSLFIFSRAYGLKEFKCKNPDKFK